PPAPEHDPPMLASSSNFDLFLSSPPVAQPAPPVAALVQTAPSPEVEERIRKLEALVTQLQGMEDRLAARVTTQLQPAPVARPPAPAGPSVLGSARALLESGSRLLPILPAGVAPASMRGWLIWDMIADLRAMLCMYLDPRYHLPWSGYILPPVLFLAYLFSA